MQRIWGGARETLYWRRHLSGVPSSLQGSRRARTRHGKQEFRHYASFCIGVMSRTLPCRVFFRNSNGLDSACACPLSFSRELPHFLAALLLHEQIKRLLHSFCKSPTRVTSSFRSCRKTTGIQKFMFSFALLTK